MSTLRSRSSYRTRPFGLATLLLLQLALPASTVAQDRGTRPSAKTLLETLCKSHGAEPVCEALPTLTEDDAWLVLRTACRDDTTEACSTFRQQQGGVLVFDAADGTWRAEWERQHWPLKFDVAGTPTLRLKSRNAPALKIEVEHVSPMTYSVRPGTPKEQDVDVIADLKTFLSLAGTAIQAVIQTAAYTPPVTASPRDIPKTGKPGGERNPVASDPCVTPPRVAPVASLAGELNAKIVHVNKALSLVSTQVDSLDAAKRGFIAQIQKAEDGQPVLARDLKPADTTAIDAAFLAVQKAVDELDTKTSELGACQPLLSAYATMLSAPANGDVINALAAQVGNETSACHLNGLSTALADEAKAAQCVAARGDGDTLVEWLKLRGAAMKTLTSRLSGLEAEEKVSTAADKVLKSKPQLLATADTLARQVRRGLLHTWNNTLIQELVVTRQNPDLPWSKIQTHSLILSATSPYTADITLSHASEETHEYRIESAIGQVLGYGIGVIVYTPLHESTWSAVTAASGGKVIGETERATRAGDLAAFLSYRFLEQIRSGPSWRVQPTADVGVGLTSGRTAFFLGGGVEIARALRVGAGWSPQRISMLADGQTANVTAVSSDNDIRTVKRFAMNNWYLSFSFALDSLSLFSK